MSSGATTPPACWSEPVALRRGSPARLRSAGSCRRLARSRRRSSAPPPVIATPSSSSLDARRELADDLALVHDEDAVGERQHLLELERDEQHRAPLVALLDEPPVDELDRADVEARASAGRRSARSDRGRSRGRGSPSAGCRPRARAPGVSGPPPRTSNSLDAAAAPARPAASGRAIRSGSPAACR